MKWILDKSSSPMKHMILLLNSWMAFVLRFSTVAAPTVAYEQSHLSWKVHALALSYVLVFFGLGGEISSSSLSNLKTDASESDILYERFSCSRISMTLSASWTGNERWVLNLKYRRQGRPSRPSPLFINSPTVRTNLNLCLCFFYLKLYKLLHWT